MAQQDLFPKKAFRIGNLTKKYTAVTHLFNCTRVYKKRPDKIEFVCL